MAASISLRDTSLWPTLGQTVADLAHHETLNRETLGAGTVARTLDRMNGMETTGARTISEDIFGGTVGNFLDTINAGAVRPRDAVQSTYDVQRGILNLYTSNGAIVDRLA